MENTKENIRKIIRIAKKIYKCKFIFKYGEKVYNFAYSVYSLFPKYDKITGIDTEKLVLTHMNKHTEC